MKNLITRFCNQRLRRQNKRSLDCFGAKLLAMTMFIEKRIARLCERGEAKTMFNDHLVSKMVNIQIIGYCLITLLGCSDSTENNKQLPSKSFTVKLAPMHKILYFTGKLQPLKETPLSSPMDAVIETMHYNYGQTVKKGDVIFTLNSAELQRQYNDTLTDYLKAKDTYTIAESKFIGTENLWAAGLISKNNYLSEKSSLNTARVTLMQDTRKVTEMLEKMDNVNKEILSNLSFAEFDKVNLALSSQHSLIYIKAPTDGVLLYAPKTSDDRSSRMTIGTSIKPGQVLALVGDLSGVSVEIDVPEINIAELKHGMHATIRGVALGKHVLEGRLVAMNAQASVTNGAAFPSFTANVEVTQLTPAQQRLIKVGMSAAVELNVDTTDKLLIPIEAIQQQNGKNIVQIRLLSGKLSVRPVITGTVNDNQVVIESGIKTGEVLVYPTL